jgi:transposase
MVEGLQRAWSRTGYIFSLEERWDAAVERLRKISPGASVGGPRTEIALDQIEAEIVRLTKPPPADASALAAASQELSDLKLRYHRVWISVRELQLQLRRPALDPIHKILDDLPHGWAEDVGAAIDMTWPGYRTAREARAAVAELLPRVLRLEGRAAQLRDALGAAAEPAEALNRKLILKLWEKVEQLSQAPAVQNGSVRKRVKELSSSGHSTRQIAEIVGCSKSTVANYLANKEG